MDVAAITAYLDMLAKSSASNINVSLSHQGKRYHWSTAPQATEAQRFQIGCVTKAIIAATVLELDASGVLDIQSPIGSLLQEFEGTPAGERVLVRHLLSDTAGYLGFPFFGKAVGVVTWDRLVDEILMAPLLFAPGSVCSLDYSNQVLLGEIIRRIGGRHWMNFADEIIGVPLFGRSLFGEEERERLWAAAAASTALSSDELVSLGEVLMTGASGPDGARLLSAKTTSRLQETAVRIPNQSGDNSTHWLPVGYGLGIPQYHSGLFGECGKGKEQLSSIRCHLPMGIVLAVCVTSMNTYVRHNVIDAVLAELGIEVPERGEWVAMNCSPADIAGEYVGLPGVKVFVEVTGHRISVSMEREGNAPSKIFGTMRDDGAFSIDKGLRVAGLSFFREPINSDPCMMIGLFALRKTSPGKVLCAPSSHAPAGRDFAIAINL